MLAKSGFPTTSAVTYTEMRPQAPINTRRKIGIKTVPDPTLIFAASLLHGEEDALLAEETRQRGNAIARQKETSSDCLSTSRTGRLNNTVLTLLFR